MKPRHVVLGATLAGAAALAAFGDRTPQADIAEAVDRPGTRAPSLQAARTVPAQARRTDFTADAPDADGGTTGGAAAGANGQTILALVPRATLIGDGDAQSGPGARGTNVDAGAGAGAGEGAHARGALFGRQDWTPPPPPPAPAPPPPPPSAPPLPFTFIGKAVADGAWEVYLARGRRTYVVHAQEVIDGTYRVDAIAPPVLTLTYLPLKQIQQLNIGVFD